MVVKNEEELKLVYKELIKILSTEIENNKSSLDFLTYILLKEDDFKNITDLNNVLNLKEFVRGANRYSDEFIFSNLNSRNIKDHLNSIFEFLNTVKRSSGCLPSECL